MVILESTLLTVTLTLAVTELWLLSVLVVTSKIYDPAFKPETLTIPSLFILITAS